MYDDFENTKGKLETVLDKYQMKMEHHKKIKKRETVSQPTRCYDCHLQRCKLCSPASCSVIPRHDEQILGDGCWWQMLLSFCSSVCLFTECTRLSRYCLIQRPWVDASHDFWQLYRGCQSWMQVMYRPTAWCRLVKAVLPSAAPFTACMRLHEAVRHVQVRVSGAQYGKWGREKYGLKPQKIDALEFYPDRLRELWARIQEEQVCALFVGA